MAADPRTLTLRVYRFPSLFAIALDVAPLVRLGHLTDQEGAQLVDVRYLERLDELGLLAEPR
jgi:hypothetical protein